MTNNYSAFDLLSLSVMWLNVQYVVCEMGRLVLELSCGCGPFPGLVLHLLVSTFRQLQKVQVGFLYDGIDWDKIMSANLAQNITYHTSWEKLETCMH